jgi:7-carboxy-7-deazaguanine synthase
MWPKHLCFTGGEPFIQPDLELHEFCTLAWGRGYTTEVFTNGTKQFPPWTWQGLQFMMDWKLPGSGEEFDDETQKIRRSNALCLKVSDGIKFVVKDEHDLGFALQDYRSLRDLGVGAIFWVTPVWDKYDARYIIEFVQEYELPWRLSLQVHKYIWPAEARGV